MIDALKHIRTGRRSLLAAVVACLACAAPASADAGKVLVFTGTAGPANAASAPAAAAVQALGAANGFTVDVTSDAAAISAASLSQYRAVAFVHSSGNVLDGGQQAALQDYVTAGGGFVGVGETAKLEEGEAFFDTLIGLTGASRTTASSTSPQDVEFLDRVHPATRANPLVWKGHTDTYYKWAANPTGKVHTVARVRFGALPDGTSVTNDAVTRFTGSDNRIQPQNERAVSWCRDVGAGRSFYTALGGTAAAYGEPAVTRQLLGAIQWAAGMSRGNCKATIDANYAATRLTPPNPDGLTSNTGEINALATAADGRVFYSGRATCFAGMPQTTDWTIPGVGKGCGTIHVLDHGSDASAPRSPRSRSSRSSARAARAPSTACSASRSTPTSPRAARTSTSSTTRTARARAAAATSDPAKQLGPGLDRLALMGERRLSRFTFDPQTKTLVAGSERVIFHWMTQVYSASRLGGAMDWDSEGNLYIATGDTIDGATNAYRGGYTNAHPEHTVPGTGAEVTISDARGTAANTKAYEGKVLRITPLADPGPVPGLDKTYTIPGADAPNGPNLFPLDDKLSKPEIFAMGVSDVRSLDIDSKTDTISAAWTGTEQQNNSVQWGPAKTETAALHHGRRQLWLAVLRRRQPLQLPRDAAGHRWRRRGQPRLAGHPARHRPRWRRQRRRRAQRVLEVLVGGPDPERLAVQHRPRADSRAAAGQRLVRPAGRLLRLPAQRQRRRGLQRHRTPATAWTPRAAARGRSAARQSVVSGGTYRRPAQAKAGSWPAYWDGRWFLADFAGAGNVRHALLMDPETEAAGGQPVAADSLYGIIPAALLGAHRMIDLDFGADGALYVAAASGSRLGLGSSTGVWRFSYTGGADTPGPDPRYAIRPDTATVDFDAGRSGGVGYEWTFSDGATATGERVTHTYPDDGPVTATLTVIYADGERVSKTIAFEIPPLPNAEEGVDIVATVPLTLGLKLGAPAAFAPMIPGVTATYTASTTATVISTAGCGAAHRHRPQRGLAGPPGQRRRGDAAGAAGPRRAPRPPTRRCPARP